VLDKPELSTTTHDLIVDPDDTIYFSAVSTWKMAIKYSIGKLSPPKHPHKFIKQQIQINNFTPRPIQLGHGLFIHELPQFHKDLFDRLLIAQSTLEDIPIFSTDSILKNIQHLLSGNCNWRENKVKPKGIFI